MELENLVVEVEKMVDELEVKASALIASVPGFAKTAMPQLALSANSIVADIGKIKTLIKGVEDGD